MTYNIDNLIGIGGGLALVFSSFIGLKCINCNSIDNSDNLKISNCDKNTSCSKMNLNLGLVSAFGTGTLLIYKNLV